MIDEGKALFQQIADAVADSIVDGSLPEETRAPSTNELAAFYRINPATAAKGVNQLVDQGVLYKRRGIGMFVAAGARERLLRDRRQRFADSYVTPLLAEARRLGLSPDDVADMIRAPGAERLRPAPPTAVTGTDPAGGTAGIKADRTAPGARRLDERTIPPSKET